MNAEPPLQSLVIVSASVSRLAGGIFFKQCAQRLWRSLYEVDVRVLALRDRFTNEDLAGWLPLIPKTYNENASAEIRIFEGFGEGARKRRAIHPASTRHLAAIFTISMGLGKAHRQAGCYLSARHA